MGCGVYTSRIYTYSGEYFKRSRTVLYIETDEKREENYILVGTSLGCDRSWKCRNVFSLFILLFTMILQTHIKFPPPFSQNIEGRIETRHIEV